MNTESHVILAALLCFQFIVPFCRSQLGPEDVYTFCGQGRSRGDNSACLGYCPTDETSCSAEAGVCTCTTPVKKLPTVSTNYDCRPARPRTRCHNACKTYAMLTPTFRRGETKVCQSKVEDKKMCYCLPKP